MTIYEKLKKLNIFIDNEYLSLYINLITNNLQTKKEKFKTQQHHIIPRCYFKLNKLKIDNSKDNLVNLSFSDHIKAHCYLCLCVNNDYLSCANYFAVNKLLGFKIENINNDTLKYIDDNKELIEISYQHVKQYLSENNPMMNNKIKVRHDEKMRSEEVRNKISKSMAKSRANSDKNIHITKGKLMKRISQIELESYLSDGWQLGTRKGRMRIHKDGHENTIWPEDFPLYEAEGWKKGGLPGRISDSHRKALNESHKDMWTSERRQNQSEILKSYYSTHYSPTAYKIKIWKDDLFYIFNSGIECGIFIGISRSTASSGIIGKWLKLGYIKCKKSLYNNWNIEKITNNKEGDINEESAYKN